jgi:hypothetical protein
MTTYYNGIVAKSKMNTYISYWKAILFKKIPPTLLAGIVILIAIYVLSFLFFWWAGIMTF